MKIMKRIATLLILFLLLAMATVAQQRGKELYDLLTTERLITTEGSGFMRWLPGEAATFSISDGTWQRVNPETEQAVPLFSESTIASFKRQMKNQGFSVESLPSRFEFAENGSAITFQEDGNYFYFSLKNEKLRKLNRPEVKEQPFSEGLMRNMRGSQLWNGEYSPNFNRFAYVKDYDLFVVDTNTGEEIRITDDGDENTFNGRPNWVYPEEFSQLTAYWWSPDGEKLAYYRSDESVVHKYPLVHDLNPEAMLESQSYPKAGEPNPIVHLFIYDFKTGKKVQVETDSTPDTYIIRPEWRQDGSEFFYRWMNRRQNHVILWAANPSTGKIRKVLEEQEDEFINVQDDFYQLKDGKHFLWSNELSGWRHLYMYDFDGNQVSILTQGAWPVGSITHVDEKNSVVYFTGNDKTGLETHFFRVNFDGTGFKQLTTEAGTHRISMDDEGKYYTDSFSSFDTPTTVNLRKSDGSLIRNLMKSDTSKLDELGLVKPELIYVKAADGKTDLHGILYKPAGYNPRQSYPLIVSVYGGPHSKSIRNSYNMNSGLQALAQLGYMVWHQDNRGLVNRGKEFETETYMKLGQVDLDDQTAGVKQITQRPYIDGNRVGVYGHSYGGYMTSIMLLKEPKVFHVGVAGAPVTDWRNYDTIYTERYMRTPQENPEGYDIGSAMPYADQLEGKLLIIHGTIDNNVHPGNSIQLINALVEAGKVFDMVFYPNNRHGIRGAHGAHYSMMRLKYFEEHLKPQPVEL